MPTKKKTEEITDSIMEAQNETEEQNTAPPVAEEQIKKITTISKPSTLCQSKIKKLHLYRQIIQYVSIAAALWQLPACTILLTP